MAPAARNQVLARLRERIVAFAASHVGRDAAEDLAQETLMLLEQKYPEVERIEELVPLSLRIVRFKMTALRRKAARRGEYDAVSVEDVQLPGADGGPAEYAERRELLERLTRALAKLGPRCRELMRLKIQGRGFPEIAKLMGAATLNTVYTWDHRCRQELHRLMGGQR